MEQAIAIALVSTHVVANIGVSMFVWRSHYYSRQQKLVQCAIVWLLPVLGVVAVGVFLYSQRDNDMFDTRQYPHRNEESPPEFADPSRGGRDA
jgi:hypothetical protein